MISSESMSIKLKTQTLDNESHLRKIEQKNTIRRKNPIPIEERMNNDTYWNPDLLNR
jgi:hypothetical protein